MKVSRGALSEEQKSLRTELQQLKGCQLQYFTLSVTGTAALFGLSAIQDKNGLMALAFLAPLAIILPCWWIFFDKATTITRIVGYYRLLENLIARYPKNIKLFIGYESALALYRQADDAKVHKQTKYENYKKDKNKENIKIFRPIGRRLIRHKYWLINWFTFFTLSGICCTLGYRFSGGIGSWDGITALVGVSLTLFSAIVTSFTTASVIRGKYSYQENTIFWEYILKKRLRK